MDPNADNYQNDAKIELAWAIKAQEEAEMHYHMITSVNPSLLKLSTHDDRIYEEFRSSFPEFNISDIDEQTLKSESAKVEWRSFCNKFEDVENFNYGSLLRLNPFYDYTEENATFATRIQFLAIEIARNREGFNSTLYEKHLNERKLKKNANEAEEQINHGQVSC